MKTFINISNSKFRLIRLTNELSPLFEIERLDLAYKTVSILGSIPACKSLNSCKLDHDPLKDCYVIGRCEEKNGTIQYSQDELRELLEFVKCNTRYGILRVTELVVRACRNKDVIDGFYNMIGPVEEGKFVRLLINLINGKTDIAQDYEVKHGLVFDGHRRYSVYQLIKDLSKDKSEILINLEEDYSRISSGRVDGEEFDRGQWLKVKSIVGNSRKPNISLLCSGKVKVSVPKNELGIKSGPRDFNITRAFCLIKLGSLNIETIGVRVSNGLAHKLERTGCVSGKILYDNELILDLTKLPIITKAETGYITANMLTNTYAKYRILLSGLYYLSRIAKVDKKVLSEKELEITKFYRGIGVYDGEYIKRGTKMHQEKEEESTKLIVEADSSPFSLEKFTKQASQFYKFGYCSDAVINKFLTSITINPDTKEFNQELDKINQELTDSGTRLNDIIFRMLMKKTLRFSDKRDGELGWGKYHYRTRYGFNVRVGLDK